MSTKIHLAVDQHGRARKMLLSAGHCSDYATASELIDGIKAEVLIADRGYDADWLISKAQDNGSRQVVIPARIRNSKGPRRDYDRELYKQRNKVERHFCRIKEYRRVLTRFEKTARNYLAIVHLAAALINYAITVNTP